MAKRRKEKDEEEDKPFKLPKFDEEAFLKRERRNVKSTFISFLLGAFIALICFGFWALIGDNPFRWELVLLVGLINGVFLKQIFIRFRLDITDFTRKNWFGSYAIYLISWIIIFIILVNPPIYDGEPPKVDLVVMPEMQEAGGDVMILAKITDNTGVEKDGISFNLDGNKISSDNFDFKDSVFSYTYKGPDNLTGDEEHNFEISISDVRGNSRKIEKSFKFSDDTIKLALPESGDKVFVANDIKFGVYTDVWRVYYTVEGSKEQINATKDEDREEFYKTSTEYKGWKPGKNITINVTAILSHNFENHFQRDEQGELVLDKNNNPIHIIYFNAINDTEQYFFDVVDESTVGQKDIEEAPILKVRVVSAPGFETIIAILALILVVLILKYRKRDKRNKK
jgi:hypothetical protein